MQSRPAFAPAATLVLAVAIAAQSQVVMPAAAATSEALQHSLAPLSTGTGFRWQQIWFDDRLGSVQTTIQEIAYRAEDGVGANRFPFPAATFTNVVVRIGETLVSPFWMSHEFAANATFPLTTAFQGTLSIPAHTPTGTGPAPFAIVLRFSQPVTMPIGGLPVLLEVTASGGPGLGYPLDADDVYFAPGASIPYGRPGTMDLAGSAPVLPGSYVNYQSCTSPRIAAAGVLGVTPLALDLGPLGAPGEWLQATPDVLLPASFGRIYHAPCSHITFFGFRLPQEPALTGARVYVQLLSVDPSANALGLRTSNGVETLIGRVPRYTSGALSEANPTATRGTLSTTNAPVARFTGTFL